MVISSIDLMDGKAVQLVQGNPEQIALQRNNPLTLAKEFDRCGEIAVIDLDAALNKDKNKNKEKRSGSTGNFDIIRQLCRTAQCRVGGGIRSVQQARQWVSLGARKIIIGSKAFENNSVNTTFLKDLALAVGKERIIVAIDALNHNIVLNGWTSDSGLDLFDTAMTIAPFVSEFLFTCVEREGKMRGGDIQASLELRKRLPKYISLTAAGGFNSIEEISTLANAGIDVQLGMALYTGKINLKDAFIESLNWKETLLPIVTTDPDGQVLMTAYTDKKALEKTLNSGYMWYFSRSRQKLWQKGESSGNFQKLIRLRPDCDRDCLLATVHQSGPACHLDSYSCFGDKSFSLSDLYNTIEDRFANPSPNSYTATLTDSKVREKLLEEALEVTEADSQENLVWEAADLLYFLTALLQKENIPLKDVLHELRRRRYK